MTTLFAIDTVFPPRDIDTVLGVTAQTGSREPKDDFFEAAQTHDNLDGQQVDDGYPYVVWTFGVLHQTMVSNLFTLCPNRTASVYVRTRDSSLKYQYYAGILLKPLDLSRYREQDRYLNLQLTIRRLQLVTGRFDFSTSRGSGYWLFF